MSKKAEVILGINPDYTGLDKFKRRALADAKEVGNAYEKALGGAGGGKGPGGKGPGGKVPGGKDGGGLDPDQIAILQARKRIVDKIKRSEIDQELKVNKVKKDATKEELARIFETERAQKQQAQHYKASFAQQRMAEKAAAQQRRAELAKQMAEERAYWDARYKLADKVTKLEMLRDKKLSQINDPAKRAVVSQQYGDAIAQAKAPTGGFLGGWTKAGGFGSAMGTVVKYMAAYRLVDIGLKGLAAPFTTTIAFLKESTAAWMDYEQAMADASRTMRQSGMSRQQISGVMGEDALNFITKYRVSLKDAAAAQYELGSANFTAAQTLQTYQTPLKVNIALMGDITQTTRLMTQMLKIHGEQMGDNMTDQEKMVHIGGVLLKTWEIEQVELSDLGNAYKYVAGNAKLLKLPIEELIPLLGVLSTYGLRGSIGGTGVNQFLTQMSRNIKITGDGLMKIQKMTREGGHEINLGLKAGDVKSPIQILSAIGKAMAPLGKDSVGRLMQSGALSDIFNIRGARPAALLSDLKVMKQYLDAVTESYRMGVKGADSYINSMVRLRQETVQGQWELLQNNIYVTGVEFMKAAAGGATLVEAIKSIINWLQQIKPVTIQIGYKVGAFGAKAAAQLNYISQPPHSAAEAMPVFGKYIQSWNAVPSGNAAYQKSQDKSYKSEAISKAAKAYLGASGTDAQKRMALQDYLLGEEIRLKKVQNSEFINSLNVIHDPSKSNDAIKRSLRDYYVKNRSSLKSAPRGVLLQGTEATQARIEAIKNVKFEDILYAASGMAQEQELLDPAKKIKDMLGSASSPGYVKTGGGGGGSKTRSNTGAAASAFRDALEAISMGMEKYQLATDLANTSLQKLELTQERVDRLMQGGVVSDEMLAQSRENNAQRIAQTGAVVDALSNQINELRRQEDLLQSAIGRAPDADTRRSAQQKLNDVRRQMGSLGVEKARNLDRISTMRGEPTAQTLGAILSRVMYSSEIFERSLTNSSDALRDNELRMSLVESRIRAFGESTEFTRQKIDLLNDSIGINSGLLEKTEARYETLKKTYGAINDVLTKLQTGGKLEDSDYAAIAGMSGGKLTASDLAAKDATGLYEFIKGLSNSYIAQAKSAGDAIAEYRKSIADTNATIAELSRNKVLEGLTKDFDKLAQQSTVLQAESEAIGLQWETSAGYAKNLADQISNLAMQEGMLTAMFYRGGMATQEYLKRLQDIEATKRPLEAQQKASLRQKTLEKGDIEREMSAIRRGWYRGDTRRVALNEVVSAMAEIEPKIKQLRAKYAGDQATLSLINDYEQTLKSDAIAKPWLEARDQIEGEWNSMFQDLFSNLTAGGDKPFKAALNSVIGSIQGQIVQGFVSKYLGSLFDTLASERTGLPAVTDAATVSLTSFDIALQKATGTLNGTGSVPGGAGAGSGGAAPAATSARSVGRWGKNIGQYAATALKQYAGGSLLGGLTGSIAGRDAESSSVAGGIGSLIGYAVGGPGGGLIGGLLGGLFGKKKKASTSTTDPSRDMYGMPAYEYESYFYNLFKNEKNLTGYALGSGRTLLSENDGTISARAASGVAVVTNKSVGKIEIHINGGDVEAVRKVVYQALNANFGEYALATI